MSELIERKPRTESIEVILNTMAGNNIKYSMASNRDIMLNVDPDVLTTKICEALEVDEKLIAFKCRKRELSDARKIIAHHLSFYSVLNQYDLQIKFGFKTRSSVSTAIKEYVIRRKNDKIFKAKCQKVDTYLKSVFDKPLNVIKPEYSIFDETEPIHHSLISFIDRDTNLEFVKNKAGKHFIRLSDRMQGSYKVRMIMTAREFMVLMNEATTIMMSEEFANFIMSDEYEAEAKQIKECVIKSTL